MKPLLKIPRVTRSVGAVAAGLAAVLLVLGLLMAFVNESEYKRQQTRELETQAQIVAASVAPALMFYDDANAQEYLNALQANPAIASAAVYDVSGRRVAAFHRSGRSPPPTTFTAGPPRSEGRLITSSVTVERDGVALGAVFLQTEVESPLQRVARYAAIGIVILLAALVIVVLGLAQGALRGANAELERRADELARTNARLSKEVAERQKAETALAHAQKMEAIGQLTGGVAHDFNNLLMVISSGLRLLETRDDEKKRAAIVSAMQQAVERGANVTKQLLAFSRRQKLSPEVALVQERLTNLRPLLERSLREDITLGLDFRGEDIAVKIDPGQFDLAVLNLAVNARDAMPKGGALTLRVEEVQDAGAPLAAISVIDTGSGMSPEVKLRAFDPFFSTKEVGKGTGLGLSQVYGFALQSGGRCELESEIGQGTTVTLLLPVTSEAPVRSEMKLQEESRGAGAILMVEDDDSVSAMVGEMLTDLGYEVVHVASAQDALRKLTDGARSVDIVFSDIIMPGGMSGIDLAREVKRQRPDLPILLTTGYGGHEELETHDFPVLRKPYNREELSAALARVASH
jgi:signal transduction histidine kinase/CheY-like chemotaxis protein